MFKQEIILLRYNKDVICVIDKDKFPVCTTVTSAHRRNTINSNEPSHDPYIPRSHAVFYNCSQETCEPIKLRSLTQITNPHLYLKSCYLHSLPADFKCERIRYNHLKNVDKLQFLKDNIPDKTFYAVDCMIYKDNSRVCNAKDGPNALTGLIDVASLVRPKEKNVLSPEEFICEENDMKEVNCDLDPYVPYENGLQIKQTVKIKGDILLKSGTYVVMLKKVCSDGWCGYNGNISPTRTRRSDWFDKYETPGGKVFRCYYAKKQQVCKFIYDSYKLAYNERHFVKL